MNQLKKQNKKQVKYEILKKKGELLHVGSPTGWKTEEKEFFKRYFTFLVFLEKF